MAVRDGQWHSMGEPAQQLEAAALDVLRRLLPDAPTTHVWTNVLFRDRTGRAGEYDAILLHHNGLYVLELKGWHGRITGDQFVWTVTDPSGRVRREPDPFQAAEIKAKRLASELRRARDEHNLRGLPIPWVEAMTVLHGQGSRVELTEAADARTWGLDGYDVRGVRPLHELLDAPPTHDADNVDAVRARALLTLLDRLGLRARPMARTVGPYEIERAAPLAEGPGWVDVRARHQALHRTFRRVRLYDVPARAGTKQRLEVERTAHREVALVEGLAHPGIVHPLEFFVSDDGPALVFPDDAGSVSLTDFLSLQPRSADTRLALVRQIGEILDYAHKRGVQHRALTPSAVRVAETDGVPTVTIRDWQGGRREQQGASQVTLYSGVTGVRELVAQDAWLYLAPEAHQPRPDGVALDVYGLGSLAHLILTGSPPATSFADLQARLEQGGLDPRASDDGLSPDLCDLVRAATDPDLAERLPTVADFLDGLTAAAAATVDEPVEAPDPRTAEVGTLIDERWEVKARLGSGGSGVALLVDDYDSGAETVVLKVALDEKAAERLEDEARVLRQLDHPRVVRLVDGPVDAGGHRALVVEDAGRPTLGRRVLDEGALTLEQLEHYGRDLFEAVAHCESRGVFHRDIKPDNLGVREDRSDRRRHLVLFDFSLSGEPLDRIRSGTHGYLDPFLGHGGRLQFDSAAERFAVAATLFEMATGSKPEWGDGRSDPALVGDDVHLSEQMFEPEVAAPLLEFFRTALARSVDDRFDSLDAMAQAWLAAFPASPVSTATEISEDEREARVAAAVPTTDLGAAGLTAQAVSAARRLGAHTVQELVDASAFSINTLPGVGVRVRSELQRRRRAWRERTGSVSVVEQQVAIGLRGVEATQRALVPTGRSKAAAAAPLARRLLNVDVPADASAWPDLAAAAAECGLPTDPTQAAALLASHWASSTAGTALVADVTSVLDGLGGLATADEIAERLVALRGSDAQGATRRRNAVGLVRAAVEADAGASLAILRHGSAVLVTTTDAAAPDERLEAAAALADAVDAAVAGTDRPLGRNVGYELVRTHPRSRDLAIADPQRLLVLAARASASGAVSSRDELYPAGMAAQAGVSAVLGYASGRVTAPRLRSLHASRFSAAEPAPGRPELDDLVRASGASLHWDSAEQAYVRPVRSGSSLLSSGTAVAPSGPAPSWDDAAEALRASLRSRSALVLTVPPHRLSTTPAQLAARFDVQVVDVTARLIAAMRERAEQARVDWSLVLRADAVPAGSADRANLDRLVADATDRFWPALLDDPHPLLLTDVAPLARYGQVARVAALLDTASARPAARWLLVPKRAGAAAPTLDGAALPVASGTWVDLGDTQRESA